MRRARSCLFGPSEEERFHFEERDSYYTRWGSSCAARNGDGTDAKENNSALSRMKRRCEASRRAAEHHFKQFGEIPKHLLDLEFFFAITMVAMVDNIMTMLMLPLKAIFLTRYLDRRDFLTLCFVGVGLATYAVLSWEHALYQLLYHIVRRTSFIKLVMVFSILDVLDQLLSSITMDAMEILYVTTGELTLFLWNRRYAPHSPPSPVSYGYLIGSAVVAVVATALHSLVLLLNVVTLNVAINAQGNSWIALLVSNNFSEVKSVVFKKHTADTLHQRCAVDTLERLQYVVFIVVMLAQHMHEQFGYIEVSDVAILLLSEVGIDFMKHVFVATFNGISLSVYASFSHLTLIDVASETVLWRLPNLQVVCKNDEMGHPTPDPDAVRQLLRPNRGFFVKHVKRLGFIPMPYVALLLWSCLPVMRLSLLHAPFLSAILVATIVLLKVAVSEGLRGMVCRFVVRTLVVSPPQPPTRTMSSTAPTASTVDTKTTAATTPQQTKNKPLTTTITEPVAVTDVRQTRTVIQLTHSLCSLLRVERFDLQAGKSKR